LQGELKIDRLPSVADLDSVGSEPFWSDPEVGPGLKKWSFVNFFDVNKSHKYFINNINKSLFLDFLGHIYTF
jgi:hypothetical protein